jgi:hypothetical protein
MPGKKTSVWLGEEELAAWKDSGDSLTEIVKRGLAAPPPEQPVTSAEFHEALAGIRDEIAALRRVIESATGRA